MLLSLGLNPLARWQLTRRINKAAAQCRQPWLSGYLRSLLPLLDGDVEHLPALAFDLEMTGLQPHIDEILSIGAVPVDGRTLRLSGAWHCLLANNTGVGQSACIHGIVDRDLKAGVPLASALEQFFTLACGRFLVAHHAPLDLSFLCYHLKCLFGDPVWLPGIDTMQLEHRRLKLANRPLSDGVLRLGACRERYGLPNYPAHNALIDAIGCGELLLAQRAAMKPANVLELLR
ncbi:exonuclease domain-containing protein [Shewanella sp. GXUN23E]|uniref:exonuclease domain-containing protein n=1 Tax=Shewanella sp. GXUN23E TaxID=3422498 RepID=UPI003D7D0C43